MISKASDRLGIDFEKLLFEENENIGKKLSLLNLQFY